MGQVYVPQVNWALMISTIAIVIGFGSSTALAAAYGIAVTLTMVITAVLLQVVATERWEWPPAVAYTVTGVFLTIDLAFFGANAFKIAHGGWLPLVIGGAAVHVDDHVEDRPSDRGGAADGARDADRGLPRDGRDSAARAGSGHGRVHDGAAARHAAGARAQSPLQQGAARARRDADGHHSAGSARAGRSASARFARSVTASSTSSSRYGFMEDPERAGGARACAAARARTRRGGRHLLPRPRDPDRDAARRAWRCGGSSCSC